MNTDHLSLIPASFGPVPTFSHYPSPFTIIYPIQKGSREIARKMIPDTDKRQQVSRLFSDMVFAHFDAFMRQMGR